MIRFHLFRALNPTERYPASPIDLSFNGVRYDLTLPPRVGIAFARLLSPDGPFRRLDNYCHSTGFDVFRSIPYSFETDRPLAAYAESESHIESTEQGVPIGYILQQAAANAAAAKQILLSVIQGPTLTLDVVDWLFGHAAFMDYCGGFEIAHICCYASVDERETALDAAAGVFDDAEPNLYRPHVTHLTIN
jgi:hypothetical protein